MKLLKAKLLTSLWKKCTQLLSDVTKPTAQSTPKLTLNEVQARRYNAVLEKQLKAKDEDASGSERDSAVDTVVVQGTEADTVGNSNTLDRAIKRNFAPAASKRPKLKLKSFINDKGILTTDVGITESSNPKRSLQTLVEKYKKQGISCETIDNDSKRPVDNDSKRPVLRFTGANASKLQNDKNTHGRLELKAQDNGKNKLNISNTLKVQQWKSGISAKTGQFYIALPLGNERSARTQKILRDLRDIEIKPVKHKDHKGENHMLIKGPAATQLLDSGLFGKGLGTESFELTPPTNAKDYDEPEQRISDEDLIEIKNREIATPRKRLPTLQPTSP